MATMITKTRPAKKTVSIMGSVWTIEWRTREEDVKLIDCDGYCDETIKTIIVGWYEWDGRNKNNMAEYTSKVLRHELIHAMLYESGLAANSNKEWAINEEMVDWVAFQLPRMAEEILPITRKVCQELEKNLVLEV